MEVFKARYIGFCFGVRRAVQLCVTERAKTEGDMCTLGPLIHNSQVVERLKEQGIRPEDKVEQITGGTVVLRTHGVTKWEEELLRVKGVRIVDATCPLVKRVRDRAVLLRQEGYRVVIVGDKEHPEVKSVLSYLDNDAIVLRRYQRIRGGRIGLVAQTTEEMARFLNIAKMFIEDGSEVRVFNTVCRITRLRQKEAKTLSRKVDIVLVVGGKTSSNTEKLFNAAKKANPCCYKIETSADLDLEWFRDKKSVGILGGTSTPPESIEEVATLVKSL